MSDPLFADVLHVWNFKTTGATDFGSAAATLALVGSATTGADGLELPAIGDYGTLSKSTWPEFNTSAFTIDVNDVKFDTFASSDTFGYIISTRRGVAPEGGFQIQWVDDGSGKFQIYVDNTPNEQSFPAGTLTVGTEHDFAMVFDGSGNCSCYIDGTRIGIVSLGGTVLPDAGTFYVGRQANGPSSANRGFLGSIGSIRITEADRNYGASYTPVSEFPTAAGSDVRISVPSMLGAPSLQIQQAVDIDVRISVPTMLGAPAVLAASQFNHAVRIAVPSPLGAPRISVLNDFTVALDYREITYEMRLLGTPAVAIPISSWQATLQTGRESYVQAVIPAYTAYSTELADRLTTESFEIFRVTRVDGKKYSVSMAICPYERIQQSRGPSSNSAVISGYTDEWVSQGADGQRVLENIRLESDDLTGARRVRCSIDWFLRPGMIAKVPGSADITADYINYYVTTGGDAFMDVGSRG